MVSTTPARLSILAASWRCEGSAVARLKALMPHLLCAAGLKAKTAHLAHHFTRANTVLLVVQVYDSPRLLVHCDAQISPR